MIQISMISSAPLDRQTIRNNNGMKIRSAYSSKNISTLNYQNTQTPSNTYDSTRQTAQDLHVFHTHFSSHSYDSTPTYTPAASYTPQHEQVATQAQNALHTASAVPTFHPQPMLLHPTQKGQKTALENGEKLSRITAGFGWNVLDSRCDVDVSAFLLGANGKVIGDSWFVFYGQPQSPDGSTQFISTNNVSSGTSAYSNPYAAAQASHAQTNYNYPASLDRECMKIDFSRLNPAVSRIVFVLTINEALENHLNFSMLKNAYVRILNDLTGQELVSFKMSEYYSNVNSMMIGELYLHNGMWKFNAIGNGVAKDLAGLCELYGVQTC